MDEHGREVCDVDLLRTTPMGDHVVLVVDGKAGGSVAAPPGPLFVIFEGQRWRATLAGSDPLGTGAPGCDPSLGPTAMAVTLTEPQATGAMKP